MILTIMFRKKGNFLSLKYHVQDLTQLLWISSLWPVLSLKVQYDYFLSDTHTFGSISDDTVNGKTFFVEFKDAGGRECTKNFEPNQGTEIKKRSVSSMVRKSSAHEKRLAPVI